MDGGHIGSGRTRAAEDFGDFRQDQTDGVKGEDGEH